MDEATLRRYLEAGGDPNGRDQLGRLWLHRTIPCEDLASFQLLLSWGASVHALSAEEESPLGVVLHHYLNRTSPFFLAELLHRGADPNASLPGRPAPLLIVCQGAGMLLEPLYQTGLDVVRLLLAYGANPNVQDEQGRTPLEWARQKGCQARIELLRAYGAES